MRVAHSQLVLVIHHIKSAGRSFADLPGEYLSRRNHERIIRHHIKRLEALGYIITKKDAARWVVFSPQNGETACAGQLPPRQSDLTLEPHAKLPEAEKTTVFP